MDVNSRIRRFLKDRKITIQSFEATIGKTNGYLSHTKSPTAGVLADVVMAYPDLNLEWLVTGEGGMLKTESDNSIQIEDPVKQRIISLLNEKEISIIELSKGDKALLRRLDRQINEDAAITTDTLMIVLTEFADVSAEWLLTGIGEMLKRKSSMLYNEAFFEGGSPFYDNLPVSAGQLGMIPSEESPSGYIKVPGVTAKWFFPVIGYSMKPEINPGDIIGVNIVDRWDRVDPDKVYMIVTSEERMIKRLRIDNEDDGVLWCISPNYPEFKILKSDIHYIYQVVFHGELM